MRNPSTIAAELKDIHDKANKAFVPANIAKAAELSAEFALSVAACLKAAGLEPEAPAESSTSQGEA